MVFDKRKKGKNTGKKKLFLVGSTMMGLGFLAGYFSARRPVKNNDNLEPNYSRDDRRYFLVYQNTSYEEERSRGYIWAPERTESGRRIFHWDNLRLVREGDLVFSLVDRQIVSFNIAKSDSYNYILDGVSGYRVDLDYRELDNSIDVDDYMDKILDLSPDKYAPFNVMGRSNSGYLFNLGEDLGEYIDSIIDVEG